MLQAETGDLGEPLPNPEGPDHNTGRAAAFLKAIANKERLELLWYLARGEASVGELEKAFNTRQPTMSQRLAVLRKAGMVKTRRDGKTIYYRVTSEEALRFIVLVDELFRPPGNSD